MTEPYPLAMSPTSSCRGSANGCTVTSNISTTEVGTMGLAWQQGPLSTRSVGQFLTAEPLPERLLFAEPLRRRMRVRFGGQWVADSEDVVLLHEPGRYPVAFFPLADIRAGV